MNATYRCLAPFLAASLLWGCYVPAETPIETVGPNETVRVVLTEAGMERLRERYARIVREIEGRLMSLDEDSVTIERRIGQLLLRGSQAQEVRERLIVARTEIERVQAPKFHWERTTLTATGLVVVAGYLFSQMLGATGGDPGDVDGPRTGAPIVVPR